MLSDDRLHRWRAFVEAHFGATSRPVNPATPAKRADASVLSSFFEFETDVLLLDDANGSCECEGPRDEHGFRVSDPERFASCKPGEKVLYQVAKRNFGVALQGRCENSSGQAGRTVETAFDRAED